MLPPTTDDGKAVVGNYTLSIRTESADPDEPFPLLGETIHVPAETVDQGRLPKATIAGGTALAVIGAGGVAAMSVGLAKNGSCTEEVAGTCTVESASTPWAWVYGGLGLAALAGSATWFAISAKRVKGDRETRFSLTPTGAMVSGKF